MSAHLSTAKAAAILTRVQLNPEIGSNNAAYVADLIQRCAEHLVGKCRLPRYPEAAKGYADSGASPSTDITGIDSNAIYISVNGSGWDEIVPTLASCGSGANIATELQAQIQASSVSTYGFDEVTVAYANSKYTITSGRYGEASAVNFSFGETYKHVAQNLLLSPDYGGAEVVGMRAREEADDVVVALTEIAYRKLGIEGIKSGTIPGDMTFAEHDLDPTLRTALVNMRRVW